VEAQKKGFMTDITSFLDRCFQDSEYPSNFYLIKRSYTLPLIAYIVPVANGSIFKILVGVALLSNKELVLA
jgi:hypothetical protein